MLEKHFTWHHKKCTALNWIINLTRLVSFLFFYGPVAFSRLFKPLRLLKESSRAFDHNNYDAKGAELGAGRAKTWRGISFCRVWKIWNDRETCTTKWILFRVMMLPFWEKTLINGHKNHQTSGGKRLKNASTKTGWMIFWWFYQEQNIKPASLLLCPAQIFNYSVTTWCIKMHFFFASWLAALFNVPQKMKRKINSKFGAGA